MARMLGTSGNPLGRTSENIVTNALPYGRKQTFSETPGSYSSEMGASELFLEILRRMQPPKLSSLKPSSIPCAPQPGRL